FDAMTRILPTVRRSGRARRMQALRQPRPYGLDLLRQINEVLASRFNASQEAVAGAIARELLGAVFHIRLPTPTDGGPFEVVAANVAGNLGPRLAPADVARLQQVSKQIGEGPAKVPAGTPPPP